MISLLANGHIIDRRRLFGTEAKLLYQIDEKHSCRILVKQHKTLGGVSAIYPIIIFLLLLFYINEDINIIR